MRTVIIVLTAALIGAIGPGLSVAAAQEKKGDGAIAKRKHAVLELAQKTYRLDLERMRVGQTVEPEHLYRWSRRWLDAQRDVAANPGERVTAYAEHLKRMESVAAMVRAQVQAGKATAADGAAADYYRAQAELWLEQAKAK